MEWGEAVLLDDEALMPVETTPKTNHSAAVSGPAAMHRVEVEVTGDLALWVRFADDLAGQVRYQLSHLTSLFVAIEERAFFE